LANIELAVHELEVEFGLPAGSIDPDGPLPMALPDACDTEGNRSLYGVFTGVAGQAGAVVRQVLETMNASRGHLTVAGTATEVAEQMIEWVDAGAADGFNVIFPNLPGSLTRFTEEVMPILISRGYVDPNPSRRLTLRDRFGAGFSH
jgi:alkanesulfonate monooxygenase SsuD/methylene tetrahydromethanopterin reductase-like flavin-dependent oxidoreductase (luciferase family)